MVIWQLADTRFLICGAGGHFGYLNFAYLTHWHPVFSGGMDRSQSPRRIKKFRGRERASYRDAPYPRDRHIYRYFFLIHLFVVLLISYVQFLHPCCAWHIFHHDPLASIQLSTLSEAKQVSCYYCLFTISLAIETKVVHLLQWQSQTYTYFHLYAPTLATFKSSAPKKSRISSPLDTQESSISK